MQTRGDDGRHRLFVSYTACDRRRARQVIDRLVVRGVQCWWMDGPRTTSSYPAEIAEALDRATGFVLVYSRDAASSRGCADELEEAQRLGLPIQVVRLDQSAYSDDFRIPLARVTPVSWIRADEVADIIVGRLDAGGAPRRQPTSSLRRQPRGALTRWAAAAAVAAVLVTAMVLMAVDREATVGPERAAGEGVITGAGVELEGTIKVENKTTGASAATGLEVVAGDELVVTLQFTNVGDRPLPDASAITANWSPYLTRYDMDGVDVSSGGTLDFDVVVESIDAVAIEGASTTFSIQDMCTTSMRVAAGDAYAYSGAGEVPDRTLTPEGGDVDIGQTSKRAEITTYRVGAVAAGASMRVRIPIQTSTVDDEPKYQKRVLDATSSGGESGTTLTARPGQLISARTTLFDQTCTSYPSTVVLRAPVGIDKRARFATVAVLAKTLGSEDEIEIGSITVNLTAGATRLQFVAGSTTVTQPVVSSKCLQGDMFGTPLLDLGPPQPLPDGITQGGIQVGAIKGFAARDGCRGQSEKTAEVRFAFRATR